MTVEEFATKNNHPDREEQDIRYDGATTDRKGHGFGDGMATANGGAGFAGHGSGIDSMLYWSSDHFEGMP